MIEVILLDFLKEKMDVPVHLEKPSKQTGNYLVFEKVGSSKVNHLPESTFAFQSYGKSLYEAAVLNKELKEVIEEALKLDVVRGITLNSDYNFTDTSTKEHRYQAVYDIRHY